MVCVYCRGNLAAAGPDAGPRAYQRLPLAGLKGGLAKLIAVLALPALLALLIYWGVTAIISDAEEAHPYPTDPAVAVAEFFEGMEFEDFQQCYKLLAPGRKAATVIGKHSRGEGYFSHFQRIATYLAERARPDFARDMDISADGGTVVFAQGVTLRVTFDTVGGLDNKPHYAIKEIEEFPIDALPGIGIESRNRGLGRVIQSIDNLGRSENSDDPAEIISGRPGESARQRLGRLIDACENARQLDTRHIVLERIVNEFPHESPTRDLLLRIRDGHQYPAHLGAFAEDILMRLQAGR